MQEGEGLRVLRENADDDDRIEDQKGVLNRHSSVRMRQEESAIAEGHGRQHDAQEHDEPGLCVDVATEQVLDDPVCRDSEPDDAALQGALSFLVCTIARVLRPEVLSEPRKERANADLLRFHATEPLLRIRRLQVAGSSLH